MLPKLVPVSKLVKLPISGKEARVYAFRIAEEKILLLNKDSDSTELERILVEMIESKTEGVDVRELTVVDIIVLLIHILDLSRGMTRHFTYKCNHLLSEDGEKCNNLIDIDVNLADYKLSDNSFKANQLVSFSDDIKCELEYPNYRVLQELSKYKDDEPEYLMRLYSKLIKAIYHGEEVYTEYSDEEIYQWTLDLPRQCIKELDKFLMSIPSISVEYDVVCPKCGAKDHYTITSLLDFFISDTQTRM